jgi:hypothetical protein
MPMPTTLDMEAIRAVSDHTEDEVLDLGIQGVLKFLVFVPRIGACEVPQDALEHFLGGIQEVDASDLREHYSGALSGDWTIKRTQLRILKESADKWSAMFREHLGPERPNKNIFAFGDLFTIAAVASSVAAQFHWDDASMANLRDELAAACAKGDLIIRDKDAKPLRHDGSPVSTEALVNAIDVNVWLQESGAQYQWSTDADFAAGWDLFNEIDDVEREIAYWSSRDDTTARDAEIREGKLAPLKLRLTELEKNKRHMRGDFVEVESLVTQRLARPPLVERLDFTLLASRHALIAAFGKFSGMDESWFDNLTDSPRLLAARKRKGQGGRHHAEPMFCPFEVTLWIVDKKRRKGRPVSQETAWRMLESHFPKVYAQRSGADPRQE